MFGKQKTNHGLTAEIRIKRCYGCGAILQDQDPNEAGYIPTDKLESEDECLCERCYKLRHYSAFKEMPDFTVDYVTILSKAKEEDSLIVYVRNCFTLASSLLPGIGKYLGKKVRVVLNERDLLPVSYSDEYLVSYAKQLLAKEGIEPLDIIITSSSGKGKNVDKRMADINKFRGGKSVFFVGAYQVGKSSLINCLLQDYSNRTNHRITTSPFPGTTLDVISIPLDENSFLYDTPGIYNRYSMVSFLEPSITRYVLARNAIRLEEYTAKEGQSFLFSNFCRVDFVSGGKTRFLFFKSNDLRIERCKLAKADSAFNSICENPNRPIKSKKISSRSNLEKHSFQFEEGKDYRVRIYGLGYFDIHGDKQVIDVYAPKGVKVIQEEAALHD